MVDPVPTRRPATSSADLAAMIDEPTDSPRRHAECRRRLDAAEQAVLDERNGLNELRFNSGFWLLVLGVLVLVSTWHIVAKSHTGVADLVWYLLVASFVVLRVGFLRLQYQREYAISRLETEVRRWERLAREPGPRSDLPG